MVENNELWKEGTTERDKFETVVFARRFLASVKRNPDPGPRIAGALDFVSIDCPNKADFFKRKPDGHYADPILSATWWAWNAALGVVE